MSDPGFLKVNNQDVPNSALLDELSHYLLQSRYQGKGYAKTVSRVKVTIGKQSYVGCFCECEHEYSKFERAVTEGGCEPGQRYTQHKIWLIGKRPKTRKKGTCFTYENHRPTDSTFFDHTHEWYFSCWIELNDWLGEESPYAQVGSMFCLSEWQKQNAGPYKDHKIDTMERFEYDRSKMSVEFLD
jgi:hypothetical protein